MPDLIKNLLERSDPFLEQRSVDSERWGRVVAVSNLQDYLYAVEFFGRSVLSLEYVWRGQADCSWPLESCLLRHLRNYRKWRRGTQWFASLNDKELDQLLRGEESAMLAQARRYGFDHYKGRHLASDVELLGVLQHFGTPTSMVDFSRNPLIALWFAATEELEKDGVVIGMCAPPMPAQIQTVADALNDRWGCTYDAGYLIERMNAQDAVFVITKVTTSDVGTVPLIEWIGRESETNIFRKLKLQEHEERLRELMRAEGEDPDAMETWFRENHRMSPAEYYYSKGVPMGKRALAAWNAYPRILIRSEFKKWLAHRWERVLGMSAHRLFPDVAGFGFAWHRSEQMRAHMDKPNFDKLIQAAMGRLTASEQSTAESARPPEPTSHSNDDSGLPMEDGSND